MITESTLPKAKDVNLNHQWDRRKNACLVAYSGPGPGIRVPFTKVSNGFSIVRGPLMRGNHVDSLPYWSSRLELDNPEWSINASWFTNHNIPGQCKWFAQSWAEVDGRCFSQVGEQDLRLKLFDDKTMNFVRNMSDIKAKAALRKGMINAPLLIAERIQTMNMVKERVGDMMRVVESVQRRDLARWRRLKSAKSRRAFAQKAASSHLELIFGWLPLIDEIEGMVDLVIQEKRDFVIGRGRHTQLETAVTKTRVPVSSGAGLYCAIGTTKRQAFSCRTNLRAEVTSHFGRNAQSMGFNPLYSLYDLTPLSFITGWFSNFNFAVQSWDPLVGVRFRTGARSERTSTTVRKTAIASSDPSTAFTTSINGYGRSHGSRIYDNRVVLSEEPDTHLVFYNNLSPFSVFAGVSLYLQRRLRPIEKLLKVKKFRYRSQKPIVLPPLRYKPGNRVNNS